MKKIYFLLIFSCSFFSAFSQARSSGGNSTSPMAGGAAGHGIDLGNQPGGYVTEILELNARNNALHAYFTEDFNVGNIYIKGIKSYLKEVRFRYETIGDYLEIQDKEGSKGLPLVKVDSFIWYNNRQNTLEKFYHNLHSKDGEISYTGVFKVIDDGGGWELLEKLGYRVKAPNYNRALDAGTTEPKVVEESSSYLYGAKNHTLIKVHRSRKKFHQELISKISSSNLNDFLKAEKIHPKRLQDLIRLRGYLSDL